MHPARGHLGHISSNEASVQERSINKKENIKINVLVNIEIVVPYALLGRLVLYIAASFRHADQYERTGIKIPRG